MFKRKLLSILIISGIIATIIPQYLAMAAEFDISEKNDAVTHWYPDRNAIDISNDKTYPGFDYVSYNNFFYNTTLSNNTGGFDETTFDERMFTWVAFGEHTGLGTAPEDYTWVPVPTDPKYPLYTKGWEGKFEPGDRVMFITRFHNNGQDPHDGLAPIAKNKVYSSKTYIGVDGINPLEPVGFIYSPENMYKTGGTTIKYGPDDYKFFLDNVVDNVARTASDSVVLIPDDPGVELELVFRDKAGILMGYDYDNDGNISSDPPTEWLTWDNATNFEFTQIDVNTTETFKIPVDTDPAMATEPAQTPQNSPIDKLAYWIYSDITVKKDDKKMWIEYTDHPGCFRYSGWAIFVADILVRPKPVPITYTCQDLTLAKTQDSCDSDIKTTNFKVTVDMDPDMKADGYFVTFYSDAQNNGTPFNLKITNPVLLDPEFDQLPVKIHPNNNVVEGQYTGTGNLYAQLTDNAGNPIKELIVNASGPVTVTTDPNFTNCTASLPTCANTCESICVGKPAKIPAGSYSEINAQALNNNDDLWKNKILYMVNQANGEFYTTKKALLAAHEDAYKNPHPQQSCNQVISYETEKPTTPLHNYFMSSVLLAFNFGFSTDTLPIKEFDTVGPGKFNFTGDPGDECTDPALNPPYIIKADQGASVWFYAKQAGTDVITVKGICTNNPDCSQKLSITAGPTCSSIEWSSSLPKDTGQCVKEGVPVIITATANKITLKTPDSPPFSPETENQTIITWYSDPTKVGTFQAMPNGPSGNPLSTKSDIVKYEGTAGIHGFLKTFGETTYNEQDLPMACTFFLPACPKKPLVCQKLGYTVKSYVQNLPQGNETNTTSLQANNIYIFQSSLTYSDPTIAPNVVNYGTKSEYGVFARQTEITLPVMPNVPIDVPEPVEAWSSTKDNVPANEEVYFYPMQNQNPKTYKDVISITATNSDQLKEPGCTKYLSLVVPEKDACQNIQLHADPTWPPEAAPANTKLSITGDLGDYDGKFKFSVDSAGDIAYLSEDAQADQEPTPKLLEVSENKASDGIYMFGPTLLTDWAVQVTASEENGTACISKLIYTPAAVVPKCESLEIVKPSSPWTLDPDEKNEDFEVKVKGTPENYSWTIEWKIPVNPEGVAHFEHETSNTYTNILQNPYEGITAFVKAVGTDPGVCEKTISPEPTTKINPTIKKRVRKGEMTSNPGNDKFDDEWDDLINISAKDVDDDGEVSLPKDSKFVTYKAEFKPGEGKGISSAVIKETLFNDGVLEGSKGGELVFQGNLWIEVTFKDSTNKKYFYEDVKDEEDKDDILEICENDTTEVCVTNPDGNANDYSDIADSFQDEDEGLVFNNIENVKKITIYYELKNETALDQEKCSTLDAEKDGCGEEFPNEVEFEAYKENDLKGDKVDEGDDDAMVIAICPFILTRAGGDVFFSTELTSGIDVAYCSEQKNIVGPIIKGVKKEEQKTPKTGIGDVGSKAFLTTPTHDICKYSNVEGATGEDSAFDNPLENFSSTICEMQAEVAKEWQQEYIVKQINQNISALSLWHDTLITNQFPPSTDTNIYSYTGKNITIPGMVVETPAAQTYIVRNGDLNITGNITYKAMDMIGPLNPKKVPSAAFIVIDGNINIDPAVTVLDGTFIAIDTDGLGTDGLGDGLIKSDGFSYNQLTINGILIGNVADLFSKRRYSGSVSLDEGSITIKFSQNFLFNTPPGLSQLLDLTQLRGAY